MVTSRLTVEVLPPGSTRIVSPGLTVPEEINPENPRKSRFGRFTHCTGIRNGSSWLAVTSSSTVSRCEISVGPPYQGVFSERVVMLSPMKPEIGIAVNALMPMLSAKAV